jgi:hypothetical protein
MKAKTLASDALRRGIEARVGLALKRARSLLQSGVIW